MKKSSLFYTGCLLVLITAIMYSCRRTTGIDNSNVIQTPFSLYFSDTAGALYNTNDGRNYNTAVYPPDGKGCRSLAVCNDNVLWAKTHLYVSTNNGKNFNLTHDTVSSYPDVTCNGLGIDLNQSLLVVLPKWDNRVYVTSDNDNPGKNWLGLANSDNSGNIRTWAFDGSYDTDQVGKLPVRMKSVTMLNDGTLCGLAYSGHEENDQKHHRNFIKKGKDATVYANRWYEATANPTEIPYIWLGNKGGMPLPPNSGNPDSGHFTLGHFNNRLIAIDQTCHNGAWYSDDLGKNWTKYAGLPANTSLRCIESPFEQVCLIGTEGKGCYILNVHTNMWEPNNQGLGSFVTVRNIAAKKNIYKNGTEKKFIYLATDQGIYESADGGRNWTRTIPGNYVAVY